MKKIKLLSFILSAALTAAVLPAVSVSASVTYYLEDEQRYIIFDKDYPHLSTLEEAGAELRKALEKSEKECKFFIPYKLYKSIAGDGYAVILEAVKETSASFDGDYLRYKIQTNSFSHTKVNDEILLTISCTPKTTVEQEKDVSKRCNYISALIKEQTMEYQANGKKFTDYDTVKFIYDYLMKNVKLTSEYDNKGKYDSAYSALVLGEASDEGIAHAFYRLVRESKINCRIMAGDLYDNDSYCTPVFWNIVQLGSKYYYVDIARDKQFGGDVPFYFLCGENDFQTMRTNTAHLRNSRTGNNPLLGDFTTDAFNKEYPVDNNRYSAVAFNYGDVNGNGSTDAVDASSILQYYAETSVRKAGNIADEKKLAADVNKNGSIDSVDASLVLSYYAASSVRNVGSLSDFIKNRK